MLRLENKVAAITGSSRGIGKAIALAFTGEGAAVAVDYRGHPDEAQEGGAPSRSRPTSPSRTT